MNEASVYLLISNCKGSAVVFAEHATLLQMPSRE